VGFFLSVLSLAFSFNVALDSTDASASCVTTAQSIATAQTSLNYTEGPNNDTTFGKWFGLNNQPWCAMSASKMYFDAGAIESVANTKKGFASCDAWLKYLTKNNQIVPIGQAKAGDVVFFQFDEDAMADHVGIVKGHNTP